MRLQRIYILTLLLAGFLLPFIPATAQEGWEGDLSAFIFDGDLLRLKPDGSSGKATITKDFSALTETGTEPALYWHTRVRFADPPSSLNTFEWTLASILLDSGKTIKYTISPDSDGGEIQLNKRTYSDPSDTDTGMPALLDELQVLSPDSSWKNLLIEAQYKPGVGLSFTVSADGEKTISSYDYPLEAGTFVPRMEFAVRYTSVKKESLEWVIPNVFLLSERLPDLAYTDIQLSDDGIFLIQLNKPVSIEGATVTVPGFNPILSQLEPDLLSVNLGGEPSEAGEFTITIDGLRDANGRIETLEILLEAYKDDEEPGGDPIFDENAQGIFLSELMVDPPPSGLLRGLRYIEIYNGTPHSISPSALVLRYRTQDFALSGGSIPPGGYAVILPSGTSLIAPGTKIYLEPFPALSGDFPLKLLDAATGTELDSYYFSSRSYDPGSPTSGFSIERVSFSPALWRSSTHAEGGTPGRATSMKPFKRVTASSVIISEIYLPDDKKERYIELQNVSQTSLDLSDLYLAHRATKDGVFAPERLSPEPLKIPADGFVVLAADTATLFKAFPNTPREKVLEKIDFPSLSPGYAELELRSNLDNRLIDHALYRKSLVPQDGYALERISRQKDGLNPSSWAVSTLRGTPGETNVPSIGADFPADTSLTEWPEDPVLSFDQLQALLPLHRDLATLQAYTLLGQCLIEARSAEIEHILHGLRAGSAPFPSIMMVIKITIRHPEEDPANPESTPPLTYTAVWQHLRR